MRKAGAAFFCVVFLAELLRGAELYVSPSGNDGNPGSPAAPFATIGRAAFLANPGDTVKIGPGLYREQLTFTRSGKKDSPITFAGTRGKKGEFLTVIEPPGETLSRWTPAPEVGPEVWKAPLEKRPDLVLMDGFMIAYINRFTMELPRWKKLPTELDEEMLWSKYGPKCGRLPGFDLLSLPAGIRQKHQYFGSRREPFWETIGNVLSGWHKGFLYVRFADGGNPREHRFFASSGSGFTLKDVSHLRFRDLHMRGSRSQFRLTGNSSHNTVERCLLMHGGSRVLIERPAEYTTVEGCILTAGFIRGDVFRLRKPDDMRGGMIYLVFKYITGVSTSDDMGVNDKGGHTRIVGNVFLQGLIGIEAFGTDEEVSGNVVREMASVGICTGARTTGKFHDNLVMNCGIPLRIHDVRHKRAKREEYHYRNLYVQAPREGSQVWVHCTSHQYGDDVINFEPGTKKYKKNPPNPVDAGKFYIYHNTFWGGSERDTFMTQLPVLYLSNRFRMAMPFFAVNNFLKDHCNWCQSQQELFAGNVFYAFSDTSRMERKDPGVLGFNRALTREETRRVWKQGGLPGLPDLSLAPGSPALETGIDISRPFTVNGKTYPALPGFAPGYFEGKAPAAGALQKGESMARFTAMHRRAEAAVGMLNELKKRSAGKAKEKGDREK